MSGMLKLILLLALCRFCFGVEGSLMGLFVIVDLLRDLRSSTSFKCSLGYSFYEVYRSERRRASAVAKDARRRISADNLISSICLCRFLETRLRVR